MHFWMGFFLLPFFCLLAIFVVRYLLYVTYYYYYCYYGWYMYEQSRSLNKFKVDVIAMYVCLAQKKLKLCSNVRAFHC